MIKITHADKWFSLCVRERSGWSCEHCGTNYSNNHQGLHCSHFFGRRHRSTRWTPDNCFSHCYGCHQKLGSNPYYFNAWVLEQLGQIRLDMLAKRHRTIKRYRPKDLKEIAKHYRQEFEQLQEWRHNGNNGRGEFMAYD